MHFGNGYAKYTPNDRINAFNVLGLLGLKLLKEYKNHRKTQKCLDHFQSRASEVLV